MDYGYLIRVAWALNRRHPFLWILGLFAASGVTSCSIALQAPFWGSGAVASLAPGIFGGLDALSSLDAPAGGAVLPILAVALLVLLCFTVLSSIAVAGMARATTGLVADGWFAADAAWRVGLRQFPRYLGLALLGLAYAVVALLAVCLAVFLTISVAGSGDVGGVVAALVLGLIALGAVLASGLGGLAYCVAAQYAAFEMAVADVGPVRALRAGLALMRRQLGTTIVLWLIAILVGIGASILMTVALLLLVAALAAVGAVVYFATSGDVSVGIPLTSIVYAAMAAAILIAVVWGAVAFLNSFLWAYWAAAYLRLRQMRGT